MTKEVRSSSFVRLRHFRPLFLDAAANGRRLDHEGGTPGVVFVR